MEFQDLPEDCIATVLSFTSPRDVCRVSLVSSTFRSVADSDTVWEGFLPADYLSIISQSTLIDSFSSQSKKHLFLNLCRKPLLVDDGYKSFQLDKINGKKCFMLSARNLFIRRGDIKWTSLRDSRFSEVAELKRVSSVQIGGRMNTKMLSPETLYGAYVVCKASAAGTYGLEDQSIRVRFLVNVEIAGDKAKQQIEVADEYPKEREDGWLEIELGEFFNKGGEDKKVEMALYDITCGNLNGGLVVQGIEIRPKHTPVPERGWGRRSGHVGLLHLTI